MIIINYFNFKIGKFNLDLAKGEWFFNVWNIHYSVDNSINLSNNRVQIDNIMLKQRVTTL